MFKKTSFPVVFNFWLALVIGIIMTVVSKALADQLTAENIIVGSFAGFFVCMAWETLIDLPGFGNFFVQKLGLKMDSAPAYFVRIFFISLLPMLAAAFVSVSIFFKPLLAVTGMMCSKDPGPSAFPGGHP